MGAVRQLFPNSGKTQCQLVVEHVEKNGGITAWEAISEFGITRLAARIHDLVGTEDEMVAEDIGDGYVRYVPAYETRAFNLWEEICFLTVTNTKPTSAIGPLASKMCENLRKARGR